MVRLGVFYEFFSGAGMVRAGLGDRWQCLFANDWDLKKAASYYLNWGYMPLCSDIRDVTAEALPGHADLAWASFPCQDLSLAGGGAGLEGERSGTFWSFWSIMMGLRDQNRSPTLIVLENVCGTLTSHAGKDFVAICQALQDGGYQFGAVIVDAALFVPQSRPRLFIVAVKKDTAVPVALAGDGPSGLLHPPTLKSAYRRLPAALQENWKWWVANPPAVRSADLSDIIEEEPACVSWHTEAETQKLLAMMSELNLNKVRAAKKREHRMVGAVYKRTRRDKYRRKVQRAEVRFDNTAGCLRTPAGGSSRQFIIVVEDARVRSRLISSRETARLMGLPDEYVLPANYNEAYHLTGDGVVVPVVRFLADALLEPILKKASRSRVAA